MKLPRRQIARVDPLLVLPDAARPTPAAPKPIPPSSADPAPLIRRRQRRAGSAGRSSQ